MAKIMNISRLRTGTDGEGITTLVGFSGCPLNCKYCLNDDCHDPSIGKEYSVDELIRIVSIDSIYFGMTGGGVTFGGGEPLLNTEYIAKFCEKCDKRWKIRLETSLNVEWSAVERLADCIDRWFIDIKDANPDIYRRYTGMDNSETLENLKLLYEIVGPERIHIRIPLIHGYNTLDDIEKTQNILKDINCRKEVFTYKY